MTEDHIDYIFVLSEVALNSPPFYVTINDMKVDELGDLMLTKGPIKFGNEEEVKFKSHVIQYEIYKELVASSINYCYWYGSHDIRPMGNSSTTMYQAVNECFDDPGKALIFEQRIEDLIRILSMRKFPMMEERKKHLRELCEDRKAENFVSAVWCKEYTGEELLNMMISLFQGFSSDMFLKRVSLFFIQLYRKFRWYEDLIDRIFVPSDYQVPKILRHFGAIEYDEELTKKVDNHTLIDKHSLEEIQIRAATIKVCKELQNITGWNAADVDTFLWCSRKITNKPFHLTITTDY